MRTSKHFLWYHPHSWIDVFSSPAFYYRYTPVLDGQAIMAYHDKLLVQGSYAEVPVITGYSA